MLIAADDPAGAMQLINQLYRAVPLYCAKTTTSKLQEDSSNNAEVQKDKKQYKITISSTQKISPNAAIVGEGIRAAAALVDMPPNVLNSGEYEQAVRDLFELELQNNTLQIDTFVGEELEKKATTN